MEIDEKYLSLLDEAEAFDLYIVELAVEGKIPADYCSKFFDKNPIH